MEPTYSQFTRTDIGDGATECLSLVRLRAASSQSGWDGTYAVQITSGPETGDDFVGVYDLDGEKLNLPHGATCDLVAAADVPLELTDWADSWATGNQVIESLALTR